jgi:hypothetical protein
LTAKEDLPEKMTFKPRLRLRRRYGSKRTSLAGGTASAKILLDVR